MSEKGIILGHSFTQCTLHERAQALFDLLNLPVLGREEDAADQLAAYILLQLGDEAARRLTPGTARAYYFES